MKKNDFVVFRYHDGFVNGKLKTYFGILIKNDCFHYVIKNIETGETKTIYQANIKIVIDKKYDKIYDLDKNRLYTRKELEDIFGEDDIIDIKKYPLGKIIY